jgi:hypothetical protein
MPNPSTTNPTNAEPAGAVDPAVTALTIALFTSLLEQLAAEILSALRSRRR